MDNSAKVTLSEGEMRAFLLETDDQLILLLPLIEKYTKESKVPLSQNLVEVSNCLLGRGYLASIYGSKSCFKSYACGYFISELSFMVTQYYSSNPLVSYQSLKFLEEQAKTRGAKEIFTHVSHSPEGFKMYGYEVSHYLLIKKLEV